MRSSIVPADSPARARCPHLLLVTVLLWAGCAQAGENLSFLPDSGDANLTFYLDNDLFADADQDYTSGARLSWISGSRDPEEFGPVQRLLQRLSADPEGRTLFRRLSGFSHPQELEYNYGFSITQLMFTPEDEEPMVAPPGRTHMPKRRRTLCTTLPWTVPCSVTSTRAPTLSLMSGKSTRDSAFVISA